MPPDPFQFRVPGTTTSLIFSKYGTAIERERLLSILVRAQYSVVKSVVAARGDGPIPQPNLKWNFARLYVSVNQQLEMTWLMLADTLTGIEDFMQDYGYVTVQFTVLDDTAGPVGSGNVGLGYP